MPRYVETKHGKGRVNWYRNSKLGVTFLEMGGSDNKFADVLNEEEVDFEYGDIQPEETKEDVREEPDEDLRSRLERLRQERAQKGRKKKNKSTSKKNKSTSSSKSNTSSKSKEDKLKDALSGLSDEEKEMLKQLKEGED